MFCKFNLNYNATSPLRHANSNVLTVHVIKNVYKSIRYLKKNHSLHTKQNPYPKSKIAGFYTFI